MYEIIGQSRVYKKNKYSLYIFAIILICTISANSLSLTLNQNDEGSAEALSILVLNGLVVSEQKHRSVALLKDNRNGNSIILKIGERINKFNLVQILENRIVFQIESETYQMYLGQAGIFGTIKEEAKGSLNNESSQLKSDKIQIPEETIVTKEFSRSYLEQRILAEWKMILDQIQISPHIVLGETKGFKLIKIPERSLLSEIGMQRDDIMLELNGEELKDKSFIISLIERFKNDDRGKLTIERNGSLIHLEFVLK